MVGANRWSNSSQASAGFSPGGRVTGPHCYVLKPGGLSSTYQRGLRFAFEMGIIVVDNDESNVKRGQK